MTRQPTLFDASEAAENAPTTPLPVASTTNPEPARAPSPLESLQAILAKNAHRFEALSLHPRRDKLWVTRDGAYYTLSIQRGHSQYRFTDRGVNQLAGLLDIPASLLERLASLPRVEDCRLLNMLMHAQGADEHTQFQFKIRDSLIVQAHSGRFTTVPLDMMIDALADMEQAGTQRLRRYEFADGGLWLEFEFPDLPSQDLSPVFDRANAKTDLWRPGALLWNQEDGSTAITTVPALIREWGGLALPILPRQSDIRKRRHLEESPEALLGGVTQDLRATRETDFAAATSRLRDLHENFLSSGAVQGYVEKLDLPFPSQVQEDAIVRKLTSGRPTHYRLLTAALTEARDLDAPARRLRVLIDLGHALWNSLGRKKKRTERND